MHAPIEVILNRHSGSGLADPAPDTIAAFFRKHGRDANVSIAPESGLREFIQGKVSGPASIIVAGGGDGTVGSVAAELIGTDKIFGVLPLGTLNHFSKDLGIPQDVEGAVDTLINGRVARVDVGEVNGRFFLNNSSLGVYPLVVRDREHQQKRLGRSKRWAFAIAALHLLKRYPRLALHLTVDGKKLSRRSPFLFVGNNEYELTGFALGERRALNTGHLGLYVTPRIGRFDLYWLLLRAFFGRLERQRDFESFRVLEARVETPHGELLVATDGEVVRMKSPLHYRIHPAALQVMAPHEKPET